MSLKDPEKRKAYKKAWYAANRERLLLKSKLYREQNADKMREWKKTWSKNNPQDWKAKKAKYPEKFLARSIANNAIKLGKLIRQPCEVCGNNTVEAHHEDYSKPLEVRWLCPKHHVEHHHKI